MRRNPSRLLLAVCLLAWAGAPAGGAEPNPVASEEQAFKEAGLATDGPSLLKFLRGLTPSGTSESRLAALIRQLGDDSFKVREAAAGELVTLGPVAVPFLRQALKSADIEVVHRARECLHHIEEAEAHAGLPAAAARLLAVRKPAGATEVLLAYLPFAENDATADAVRSALAAVGMRNGRPDKALLAALGDPLAVRRAAAVEVLAQSGPEPRLPVLEPFALLAAVAVLVQAGTEAPRAELRPLLHDPNPLVRLRAALARAAARDREAVPVLIDLLDQLPATPAWQAEDFLLRLAGDEGPAVPLSGDAAARRKCREAWAAWWQAHGAAADLGKALASPRWLGYTLLVMLDAGRVVELGADDKPRLQIDNLSFPLDAQMLPGDRVLVAEYNANRVIERDRKGAVIWEKQISEPLAAQRLPNGRTFIATRLRLLEVDRDGKEVFAREVSAHARPPGAGFRSRDEMIMKACQLPNGQLACVTTPREAGVGDEQRFIRLDPSGRELQSFPVHLHTSGGRLEVHPDGHILIPELRNDRVVEYDASGKVVWQAPFLNPVAAVRLPNGNTLVTSYRQNRAVELDRDGKEVWEYQANTRVTRAFRR